MLQAERLKVCEGVLNNLWKEIQSGCVDEDLRLQDAVNAQVDIDRIVWKLNELNEERIRQVADNEAN